MMKLLPVFAVLALFSFELTAQVSTPDTDYHHIGLFWGSLRTPYSVVVSGVDYQSAPFADNLLSIDARLQSWGSFFIVSPSSFDVELALLAGGDIGTFRFAGGAGYKVLARLYVDERSSASTGYAPFIRGKMQESIYHGVVDLDFSANLDVSFYNNGLSVDLTPQLTFGFGWFFASVQVDGSALMLYNQKTNAVPGSEFRWDTFATIGVRLH